MKPLLITAALLSITATAAGAGCPTLSGYMAFKRCYLETGGLQDPGNLQALYDKLRAEDIARVRAAQNSQALRPDTALRQDTGLAPSDDRFKAQNRTPLSHRNTEAEINLEQALRQQNSFDAARALNNQRVEQGRARSQNLLYGQGR